MNRNLKIFLANGIPFGIFMAVLFSFLSYQRSATKNKSSKACKPGS